MKQNRYRSRRASVLRQAVSATRRAGQLEQLETRLLMSAAPTVTAFDPTGTRVTPVTSPSMDLSSPLQGPDARGAQNYRLTNLGADGKFGGTDDRAIGLPPSYLDGSSHVGLVAAADLRKWHEADYFLNLGVMGDWQVASDGSSVTQAIDGGISFLVSDYQHQDGQFTSRLRVTDTGGDDDLVGVAFGMSEDAASGRPESYYLLSWKAATQGAAKQGLRLLKVTGTGASDYTPDLWGIDGDPHVQVLGQDLGVGWQAQKDYDFSVHTGPGGTIGVAVTDAATGTSIWSFQATDASPLTGGKVAFYNYGQASVRYAAASPYPAIPEGKYAFTAISGAAALHGTDDTPLDGNGDGTGGDSYSSSFTVNTVPPGLTYAPQAGSDTGVSAADRVTADNTPTFDLTVNRSGRVLIEYVGQAMAYSTTLDVTPGTVPVTAPALPDGTYTVRLTLSPTLEAPVVATYPLVIDTHGPRLLAGLASEQSPLSARSVKFSEAVTGLTAAGVTLTGPGGAAVPVTGLTGSADTYAIAFAPQVAAGAYTVRVTAAITDLAGNPADQDGDGTNGEAGVDTPTDAFQLLPDTTAPQVASFTPTGIVTANVSVLRVKFNEAIKPGTFSADDVTIAGPSGPIAPAQLTITAVDDRKFDIATRFLSVDGSYSVAIGPAVTDLAGNAMAAAYTTSFVLDKVGPRVTAMAPTGAVLSSVDHVDITFSEAIAVATLTTGTVEVVGPVGAVAVTGVTPVGTDGKTWRVAFAPQGLDGTYTVKVKPTLKDLGGSLMDQDGDGVKGEAVDDLYTAQFSISPRANLTIGSVAGPATGQTGGAVTLTWVVTNTGPATASGPWTERSWCRATARSAGTRRWRASRTTARWRRAPA